MTEGVGDLEAHVLHALGVGMPAQKFGRIHHLPPARLAAVIDGMRAHNLIADDAITVDEVLEAFVVDWAAVARVLDWKERVSVKRAAL